MIRAQCRLSRSPAGDPERHTLEDWVRLFLLDAPRSGHPNGVPWQAELPNLPGITWGTLERGFVAGLRAESVATLAALLPVAVCLTPIQTVEVAGETLNETTASALVDIPQMQQVQTLRLRFNYLTREAAQVLIHAPHLANVQTLDLLGCRWDQQTVGSDLRAQFAQLRTGPI